MSLIGLFFAPARASGNSFMKRLVATAITDATPKDAIRVRNPKIRASPPKNSTKISTAVKTRGLFNHDSNNFKVPIKPGPPKAPKSF